MAKYLRPRRGTAANAQAQDFVLRSGELFLEIPTGGSLGKSAGRIVVGDGNTGYNNLNYASTAINTFKPFITDPSLYTPIFTNSTYASSGWTVNSGTAAIDKIGNGTGQIQLPKIVSGVKEALCIHEDSIHALNNSISGYDTRINQMSTAVDSCTETVNNLSTAVNALNTKCATTFSSLNQLIDNAFVRINSVDNTLTSKVNGLSTTVSDDHTTLTNLSNTCDTKFTNYDTDLSNYYTTITSLNTSVSRLQSSCASTFTALASSISSMGGGGGYTKIRKKQFGRFSSKEEIDQFIADHKIRSGEFEDLELGDEIKVYINGSNISFIIAGIDTYYGSLGAPDHHIVLVNTGSVIWDQPVQFSTSVKPEGYYNSNLYKELMTTSTGQAGHQTFYTAVTNFFGSRNLTAKTIHCSSAANTSIANKKGIGETGAITAYMTTRAYLSLLSEVEVFGSDTNSTSIYDNYCCSQLPLFSILPIYGHEAWSWSSNIFWLRSFGKITTTDYVPLSVKMTGSLPVISTSNASTANAIPLFSILLGGW